MDLAAVIQEHGYAILAVGCLFEGETIVALAGFAAHQGYLSLTAVLAVAAAAGFAGDQFYFWLGRRHGDAVLKRWPAVAAQAERLRGRVGHGPAWMIVGVRFAFGLRIAGPIVLGTSAIPGWRFAVFNALGAALWATVFALLGWTFGRAVEAALGRVERFEAGALAIVAVAAALWLLQRRRHTRPRGESR